MSIARRCLPSLLLVVFAVSTALTDDAAPNEPRTTKITRCKATDAILEQLLARLHSLDDLQSLNLIYPKPELTPKGLQQLSRAKNLESFRLLRASNVADEDLSFLQAAGKLTKLEIRDCPRIDGSALKFVGNAKALETLVLRGEGVTDRSLEHVSHLTGLKSLDLNGAKITDAGLKQLADLTSLEKLVLTNCHSINGSGLTHLAGLKKLNELGLASTQVDDAGLTRLGTLPNLQTLSLTGTKITDTGIGELTKHSGLTNLYLYGTAVTSERLPDLARLKQLSYLNLRGTAITDANLESLQQLPHLRYLYLTDTRVTAAARDELQAAMPQTLVK